MGSNNLETVITMNELGLQDSIPPRLRKKNTEPDHLRALKELSANKNIVIKPADKGGATVIQNRADYVAEGNWVTRFSTNHWTVISPPNTTRRLSPI